MDKTISHQLDRMFQEASQSHVRKLLKTDQDHADFEAIRLGAAGKLSELNRLYEEEYLDRVETMRQRLYDEAAQVHLNHPAPSGIPTNSGETIEQRAHRLVQSAHKADQDSTLDEAQQALEELWDRVQQRDQAQGISKSAFTRAGERRSGLERRQSIRRSD